MGAIDWLAGGGATSVDRYKYNEEDIDPARAQEQDARGYQEYLQGKYKDAIEGRGESLAQAQMEAQNSAAKRQQLAMARSGGGGALGQAGAMRMAQTTAAQQDADLARSAGMVRAKEQADALAGMTNASGQMRGQDQARMGAEMDYESAQVGAYNQYQANKVGAAEGYAGRRAGVTGGLVGAGAMLGAGALMSDERVKTDIRDVPPEDLEAFLEAAAGHRYRYREGLDEPGRERVGVMAQDLEQTRVGDTLVDEGPDGVKRIDTAKGYGAMLAAMHEMNARLAKLEGKK